MSRHDERERIRRRLSVLTERVGASRTIGAGSPARTDGELCRSSPSSSRSGQRSRRRSKPPVRGGRWDDEELSEAVESDPEVSSTEAAGADLEDDDDGVGEVRAPSWLDEPKRRSAWRDHLVPERFRGTRLDPGWRGLVTLVAVGLAAVVVAAVVVLRERPVAQAVPLPSAVRISTGTVPAELSSVSMAASGSGPSAVPVTTSPTTELVISVVGLVHRGGLVRLPAGARVADALAAAGGAKDGADLSGLNLAQRLQDGDQVLVGSSGPNPGSQLGSTTISAGGRPPGGSAPNSAAAQRPASKVDLNTATEAELDALPGIGPVTARAIVTWRTTNGRFADVAQLGEVDGIGPARLARLRDLVTV
ncbi:ComEA family DNA-binding protein [Nocardia pseudovaccinii]|uniref:ComEA family DNA-binding protein n=1 Tax=Nocardia pseudovaccinii TaxID=189540 RepID=UPI000AF8A465|nr:ComEA family DNA-binding protein [Nocardia pseudovaccinii]